jgi:hypothetical protein
MIIQPSHDATIEATSKVYENGAEFALQGLLMWLNRAKEKFAVEQTIEESDLTIERIEESDLTIERIEESGLTVERIEESRLTVAPSEESDLEVEGKIETLSSTITPAKLEQGTGEDPWGTASNTIPDSQLEPNRLDTSKVEAAKTEQPIRLLYGIKDGKLVNNLSQTEALAVAGMVNGKLGTAIPNGANLRIKFNGKIIAETDSLGKLIANEIYGKVPKEGLIEFNNRIAKIAETPTVATNLDRSIETPAIDTPAVATVAKNLDSAPQTPGKTFLQRLLPPYGKRQQTLTPEQEVIKEHLAQSPTKNEYAFKNLPQGDIVYIKTAIAFTEANTTPGKPLVSPKGYVVSSKLNRDKTVTYQYKTPDGKVAIEATNHPATGTISIHQCQLTNETRQHLKDLQTTLERPPLEQVQAPMPTPVVIAAQPEIIMPQSTNQVPVVERKSFQPTVINPDPRKQSAYQEQRDLDLEQKVFAQTSQQSESGENVKYYDLRSIDNDAFVMIAHNFTTDTLVILDARVVQAGTEAGRQSIQGIAEYELYSPDPDGDIKMRLTYDPIADKIDIKEVNIGRDTIEMWNSLDRSVAEEKARWEAVKQELQTLPQSQQAQATTSVGVAHDEATPQSLPDSVKLANAEPSKEQQIVAEAKAAKAATAKAKREEKKAEKAAEKTHSETMTAAEIEVSAEIASSTVRPPSNEVVAMETKIDRTLDLNQSQAKPSTTPNQIETDTPSLTKKEQLVAQGKATRASKTNSPKAPTKAKTPAKGGRG